MKKWFKRIGIGLGVVLVLAVSAALVFFYVLHPKLRDAPVVTAPKTPEVIARGKYLANNVHVCAVCHSPTQETVPGDPVNESQLFAGRVFPDPDFPGTLVAPNLTPARLGAWTDGEILRAIREGVSRDGRTLFPMMPYAHYRHLTDDDTLAIIAYLRTLPPIENKVPAIDVSFPVSMFVRLGPQPLAKSPPAYPADPVGHGTVLLETMGCVGCHTPFDDKGQPDAARQYAGGMKFGGGFGTVYSSNITSDAATGIGSYTDDDLMRVFKEGKGKDGRPLYAMPWRAYQGVSDGELRAVIAALRTLKPQTNVIPAPTIKQAVGIAR